MGKKVVEAKVPCSEELKKGHLVQNMQFVSFSILQEKNSKANRNEQNHDHKGGGGPLCGAAAGRRP